MNVVGMMSGTSLDGMDLVLCSFSEDSGKWKYEVKKAVTLAYDKHWIQKLSGAQNLSAVELILLHNEYGTYIGKSILGFIGDAGKADLVSSHGHTVFHQPGRGMTFQAGNGPYIAAACGIPVVSDFRSTDTALGGQGAPLVPIGDKLLFNGNSFCLNLGGFANISNDVSGTRIASDLCPVNIVANRLANLLGHDYDKDGLIGRQGKIIDELVTSLNNLDFYQIKGPKSLGREWVEKEFLPVAARYNNRVADVLRSFYEHVAIQISNYINSFTPGTVLVTGGGAYNNFLMELLRNKTKSELKVPDDLVVKYKEAIIFAFLGFLRFHNRINCLSSVTGATRDSSAGAVYMP